MPYHLGFRTSLRSFFGVYGLCVFNPSELVLEPPLSLHDILNKKNATISRCCPGGSSEDLAI